MAQSVRTWWQLQDFHDFDVLAISLLAPFSPHISPVSATASQVLPWLRYVSVHDPRAQKKNTTAVVNLTCLATKGLNLFLGGIQGLATKRMKYPGWEVFWKKMWPLLGWNAIKCVCPCGPAVCPRLNVLGEISSLWCL
jgi:hypothetical protein